MKALDNWKEEKRSAYLYRKLSELESNPIHKKLFLDLAGLAEKQAAIWENKLKKSNIPFPTNVTAGFRAQLVLLLAKHFGARSLRVALSAMKIRGMSIYHGEIPHPTPEAGVVENQHHTIQRGNNIRAAVFGINDGLISNTSLILGIAGAHAGNTVILISGVAGLLAGACSMAAGEYISVRSQREMLEYQLELEKSELEIYPEEEAEELSLIYQARGIPKDEADKISYILIQDPKKALETLAREELGINPDDLASPEGAALASFFSFGMGAFIPLIPFLISKTSETNIIVMILLTGLSLFCVGGLLSIFTQRNMIFSGLRMLMIGAMAGILTYLIGTLFKNV